MLRLLTWLKLMKASLITNWGDWIFLEISYAYSSYLSNLPQKGSQGEAPQRVLYFCCGWFERKLL